ncbi:GNAT family N-acetyltransferase [Gorillibacterium sp. sgz500922]|uniref:GNAT family N-acetyltransferase n=1 Tax=Gorillibacterium sp. sgz500922 TaxID=3446694 RepID=UPI003F667D21
MSTSIAADSIRIVEYEPAYAKALAEMWNRSNESWGGGTHQRTEDSVRREMANSTNLHVFLAVDGEEVVGFCSFSHYRSDEGALYVPLLNVRPDYHGRKVGRNLIRNAVRKTVEMGWPRLDLFTWAGNTKAVPMYKKCGFFWEKKDDAVHLMNFIPTILQTEALAPYFAELDWYADGTRPIAIEPDGRRERNFDFFEYTWQKEALSIRAEFEKTGRGLTALETPDYAISTEVDEHDLVFGATYPVRYRIVNKSASPLTVEIKGRDDKNIRFSATFSFTLAPGETRTLEGEFELEPVQEEQNDWKTHPVVMSEWLIGGRRAEFRIGIAPKFPAKVSLALPWYELNPGMHGDLYVNVENNYAEPTEYSFAWPEDDSVEWEERLVRVTVPGKGKASVAVPFRLKAFGLFSHEIEVTAATVSGKEVRFNRRLYLLLKGTEGRFGGDAGEQWLAANGRYSIHHSKQNNTLWVECPGSHHNFWLVYPKLGKPFSEEFSKKTAEEFKTYSEGDSQVLEILYESEDFSGYQLKTVAKLLPNGIVKFHHEVCNANIEESEDGLSLMMNFGFFGRRLILPYRGHYIDMKEEYTSSPDLWETEQLTENWLFCQGETGTYGIAWDPALSLLRPEYPFGLEIDLGKLTPGSSAQTPELVFALNTFPNWGEFRAFATKRRDPVLPMLSDHLELVLGEGNPFAEEPLQAKLEDAKTAPMAGQAHLYLEYAAATDLAVSSIRLEREQDLRSARFETESVQSLTGSLARVRAVYEGEDWRQERTALWLPQSGGPVACEVSEGEAGSLYTADNGVLRMESAPQFGSVVHSLRFKGEEWLDHSYPQASPRSWWNPWHGGLGVDISGINGFSREEEPRSADHASLTDSCGNVWTGLRLTTRIEKKEAWRGLTIRQHYLLLPGVPVLCMLFSVKDESGLYRSGYPFMSRNFFRPSPTFAEGWMEIPGKERFQAGITEVEISPDGLLRIGSASRKDLMHVAYRYPTQTGWAYLNNQVLSQGVQHYLPLTNDKTSWTQPTFLLFGELPLKEQDLQGLWKLSFSTNTD